MSPKEEIIAAIRRCAEKLGRNPSFPEARRMERIKVRTLQKHFASYTKALRAAGLEPRGGGHPIETADLLKDWAATARRLSKLPTVLEYDNDAAAKYSSGPYQKRFARWAEIAPAFQRYTEVERCETKWADVLAMIDEQRKKREIEKAAAAEGRRQVKRGPTGARFLEGRPVWGPPVAPYGMMHEPANEACVMFLFGAMAQKMGDDPGARAERIPGLPGDARSRTGKMAGLAHGAGAAQPQFPSARARSERVRHDRVLGA